MSSPARRPAAQELIQRRPGPWTDPVDQGVKVILSLRSSCMIELQQSAQPLSALDLSLNALLLFGRRNNKVVLDALMVPLQMIMGGVLLEYVAKRPFAEENHPIQTFGFNRQDKSLSVRVQIRRSRWYLHRLDIHRSE